VPQVSERQVRPCRVPQRRAPHRQHLRVPHPRSAPPRPAPPPRPGPPAARRGNGHPGRRCHPRRPDTHGVDAPAHPRAQPDCGACSAGRWQPTRSAAVMVGDSGWHRIVPVRAERGHLRCGGDSSGCSSSFSRVPGVRRVAARHGGSGPVSMHRGRQLQTAAMGGLQVVSMGPAMHISGPSACR
jgi:hypothetical protein